MKKTLISVLRIVVVLIGLPVFGQTSGISEVINIENKAEQWVKNKEEITRLNIALSSLYPAWEEKLQRLRNELAALYKERDDLIADMKIGARCSQCGKYKSAFEKEGQDFQKHLGEVKGYAVPATTEELEQTRKYYAEKIAYKKVQIQQLEKGDPEIIRKKAEITRLEERQVKLCNEITAHSRSYQQIVFNEAKGYQEGWAGSLCSQVSDILISEDQVLICEEENKRAERWFQQESVKIREQVKKEVRDRQQQQRDKIFRNEQRLVETRNNCTKEQQAQELQLALWQQQLSDWQTGISKYTSGDSRRDSLQRLTIPLTEQIAKLKSDMTVTAGKCKSLIAQLENENQALQADNFRLETALPGMQTKEVEKLRPQYEQRRKEAAACLTRANARVQQTRKDYRELSDDYTKRNQAFYNLVATESDRMQVAGRKAGCTVLNETRGMVIGNWNKLYPCVNNLTKMAKPYSTGVFNSYCSGPVASAKCLSAYISFLQSLSDENKTLIKASTNQDLFDKLMRE